MKRTIIFLILLISSVSILNAQNKAKPAVSPKAEVYYFHPTERCPIDQAIEDNTRQLIKSDFAKEVKDGILNLRILNTDDKINDKTVAKFEINTQALYVVKYMNGKEIKTDLTKFAFDEAASNPQKFRMKLKDEIESALK